MMPLQARQAMDEQVLDLARRVAEQAEVFSITSVETPVDFEANRLKQVQRKEVHGLALRVVVDGRVGLASTTRMQEPESLVETALAMARYGAQAHFVLPGPARLPQVQVYDPAVERLAVEQLVAMGQTMIDRVRAHDPRILCDAGVNSVVSTARILNSAGAAREVRKTVLSVSLHGNLVRGTDMLDVYEEASSCRADLDCAPLAMAVIEKTGLARRQSQVSAGAMPVVFTPKGVAMTIMAPLRMALSGKMVLQGASPLGDRLGRTVADTRFSLHDDGTLDWAPGSGSCDHEGVPCQRTPLVEGGRVVGFYYDLQTAGLAGTVSTANGFRSLDNLPGPANTSLVVTAGECTFAEMVASMKNGLVIDQTMGAWSGNLISGEFSANVHLGYKVENGQIVGRVKDTMVAGNVFQALTNLDAIGAERTWVGDVFAPALGFKSLGVACK